MTTASRMLASLTVLTLLLGCETGSDRNLVGTLVASNTATFSAWSEPVGLGPTVNASGFNDQQAAPSKDGLSLFFASARPESPEDVVFDLNIWVSQRACANDGCPWGTPVSLGSTVNSSVNDFAPVLSRDGHWIFFASARQPGGFGSGDIWASYRGNTHDDFGWEAPVNLGAGVNASGFEGGPGYFENDEAGAAQLYFNKNPLPSNAAGDIYVSEQAADGSWGTAVPVPELNSDSTDQRPSVASNGLAIYFYSNRLGSTPNSLGTTSTDIWVSTREGVLEPWSAPTNVGAPINTAAGEAHPFIFSHGRTETLYITRNVAVPPAVDQELFVSTWMRQ
jgi:Tol biopolymer transport system component